MKPLDRLLQRWRLRVAARHLPGVTRLIDIGAHQGELFQYLGPRLQEGFGIEPLATAVTRQERYELHPGFFPETRPTSGGWDAITMLAVLEHVPETHVRPLARACAELLRPGGRLVITVPTRVVDHLLYVLKAVRLVEGMSLEEHHGFDPERTPTLFSAPEFDLLRHQRFQLGLNHLFVFRRR